MARKRMISPEFFTSRTLNDLPVQAMVTFAGLWCHADDMGRAEDDIVMIKAAVWPRRRAVTETKVEADLATLDKAQLICRYAVNGYEFLHVVNWNEHQKINHPTESKLPPCQHHEPAAWDVFLNDPDTRLTRYRKTPGTIRDDSLAIEVKSVKEKLSADEPSCVHGFPESSNECEMCDRKRRRAS